MSSQNWGRYRSEAISPDVDYVDDNDLDDGGCDDDNHDDELNDQVERIERDSGDTYGCQPSPGPAAEVKVHVIREGGLAIQTFLICLCANWCSSVFLFFVR